MIYKDALSKNESDKLSSYYKNIIEVTKQDIGIFACNSIVSGNNIVMPFGISEKLKKQIEKYEFNVFEIEFSEYLKGGGAIHCTSLEIHD
jgi:N-dimethylarginine dimethylaminohydrolase